MNKDVIVKVNNLSKKFCRTFKRSLWYGIQDVAGEFLGHSTGIEGLRKDEFWALNDVSFELRKGECLALIGPNGAGKSTLLKILNGLVKPDKGQVEISGQVGALIELGAGFNPILTGRENVYVNGAVLGLTKKEVDSLLEDILAFAEVSDFIDTPVQNYSSGMRVRLGFAVAAHLNPDVLLIDEVLAVGDVGFRMKCYDHLLRLMDNGTSIIVVSHAVNMLSRITSRAVVLHHGKNIFDGELAKSIGEYEHCLKLAQNVDNELAAKNAFIDSIRLTDESGAEKTEFMTGDTLYAEISLRTDRQIEGARLVIALESPSVGVLGSFSSPATGFDFDVSPPGALVRLEMPSLPLLVGGYFMNCSFYGPNITDFLDRKSPGVPFKVGGPATNTFGFGVSDTFKFDHAWSLLK